MFGGEFFDGGVDFGLAEVVDGEVLDDLPVFAVGGDGEGGDDAGFDSVGAVAADGDAVPVAGGCGVDE